MATFFGEVLPVYSRAVDDEEEEDDTDEKLLEFTAPRTSVITWSAKAKAEMKESPDHRLQCSTVIIAYGSTATAFCRVYLMEQPKERIAVLCSGLDDNFKNSLSQSAIPDKTCYVYRLLNMKDIIIVMCNTPVMPEQSFSWTANLFNNLKEKNTYVAILTTASVSDFKSEVSPADLQTPFLRALRTAPFKGTPLCSYLEQPNTMCGLPAQVLTYAKVHQMAAVIYICYVESTIFIDANALHLFKNVLQTTPFKDACVDNPKAKEQINDILEAHAELTSLYT